MYEKEVLELQFKIKLLDWSDSDCNLEYLEALQLVKDIEGLIKERGR